MNLTAVVLTLGEDGSFRAVVAGLVDQGVAAERICVVHNPLHAGDAEASVPPGVEVIRMPRNLGYAGAMNVGMRHQIERGADWIWLLTQDVRLRPGAVDAMRAAAADPEYGALGPILLQAGTDLVFSLGGARTRFGWPYNAGFGSRLADGAPTGGAVRRCAWVDGSSIMLRTAALREAGLYDTSLFGYAEDALLCLRLERAGWATGVVQAAAAEQVSGQLSRPGLSAFLIARNCLRYAHEAAGRPGASAALMARYLRQTIHFVRVGLTGPRRRAALIQCLGTWVGTLAFFAGRTGPPPTWLPGRGELGN